MSKTEHYQLQKPDEEKTIEQEFRVLQTVWDMLDAILFTLRTDVDKKSLAGHGHAMSAIEGLVNALSEKMPASKKFGLADLTDVFGSTEATLGYILVKTAQGWQAQSALSTLGDHKHKIQDITNFTEVLADYITKTAADNAYATKADGALARSAVQPAGLTKGAVGLGNVDNTSDTNKPVSTAQQNAIDAKLDKTGKAADSALLNGKDEAGMATSGPIFDAMQQGKWPGVYAGTDSGELNFPIGHTVSVDTTNNNITRNASATIYRANNAGDTEYSMSTNYPGGVSALTGVYRARGGRRSTNEVMRAVPFERVS